MEILKRYMGKRFGKPKATEAADAFDQGKENRTIVELAPEVYDALTALAEREGTTVQLLVDRAARQLLQSGAHRTVHFIEETAAAPDIADWQSGSAEAETTDTPVDGTDLNGRGSDGIRQRNPLLKLDGIKRNFRGAEGVR